MEVKLFDFPEGEVEEEPAHGQAPGQGGVGQPQSCRDVGLLLQHPGPEVLLGAGDDAHVAGELSQLLRLSAGRDTEGGVEGGGVGVVALHVAGHVPPRGDADGEVGLEVVVADSPGQDGVAGDDQVVDAQRYEGAVVGRHAGRAQDLAVADPPQSRDHVPDIDTASTAELSQGQLHEVERPPHKQEDDHVGDEEGSSTILVGREGKPPDVAKTWSKPCSVRRDISRPRPLSASQLQSQQVIINQETRQFQN